MLYIDCTYRHSMKRRKRRLIEKPYSGTSVWMVMSLVLGMCVPTVVHAGSEALPAGMFPASTLSSGSSVVGLMAPVPQAVASLTSLSARSGIHPEVGLVLHQAQPAFEGRVEEPFTRAFLDLGLEVDGEWALGLKNSSLYGRVAVFEGSEHVTSVGSAMGDIDFATEDDVHLERLYYEQELLDEHLRIQIGKLAGDDEFAVSENAGPFIGGAAGLSVTMALMPQAGDSRLGVNAFFRPNERFSLGAGVFDVSAKDERPNDPVHMDSGNVFMIAEVGTHWGTHARSLRGRLRAGAWVHNGEHQRFDGTVQAGTSGTFFVFDQDLWHDESGGERHVGLFARYGNADPAVMPVSHHVGAGMTLVGLFAPEAGDVFSAGGGFAWLSPETESDRPFELAFELAYAWPFSEWGVIQPNVQYFINPSGNEEVANAVVGSLRLGMSL